MSHEPCTPTGSLHSTTLALRRSLRSVRAKPESRRYGSETSATRMRRCCSNVTCFGVTRGERTYGAAAVWEFRVERFGAQFRDDDGRGEGPVQQDGEPRRGGDEAYPGHLPRRGRDDHRHRGCVFVWRIRGDSRRGAAG